jgi:hypothetical protein
MSWRNLFSNKPFKIPNYNEIDGLYFEPSNNNKKSFSHFLTFTEDTVIERDEDLGFDKWLLLLTEKTSDPNTFNTLFYQCYIGNPLVFATNQVEVGTSGAMVKKSLPGFRILHRILSSNKNKDKLSTVYEGLLTEFKEFCEKYNIKEPIHE